MTLAREDLDEIHHGLADHAAVVAVFVEQTGPLELLASEVDGAHRDFPLAFHAAMSSASEKAAWFSAQMSFSSSLDVAASMRP